jgi:YggT family protein
MDAERETGMRRSWREREAVEAEPGEGRPTEDRVGDGDQASGPVGRGAEGTEAAPPPPEVASGELDRRSGEERRVVHERVEEERRVEPRRAPDRAARERRRYVLDRVTLGVDYLFYLLYGLLAIRFVLGLLGAAETAGFVQFIRGMTDPFYAPFSGIVASPALNGGVMDFPIVIALLAYVLLHVAIRGLIRLLAGDRAVA